MVGRRASLLLLRGFRGARGVFCASHLFTPSARAPLCVAEADTVEVLLRAAGSASWVAAPTTPLLVPPSGVVVATGGGFSTRGLLGAKVGFISNGKEGTKGFFKHLDQILREEYGVASVVSRTKSNYSAPADPHIVAEIKGWDAVVSGLGD